MKVDHKLGYICKVKVHVSKHLHDKFCDLPPLLEKIVIDESMLSAFQRKM